jgi:FkbM family methyltransferase
VLRHGVAAATEHRAVVTRVRPDVVLDVGANRGQFTLLVKGLFPSATVVAFEPVEQALAVLRRLAAGMKGVTVVATACGAQRGSTTVNVAEDDDNSSLLPPTHRQLELDPRSSTSGTEAVDIAPLDDLVDQRLLAGVSLLKIDVQGTELDVLRGATNLLKAVTYLYVELSFLERYAGQSAPSDIVRLLDRSGFALLHLHNPISARGGLVQVDALFGRASCRNWSPLLERR